MTRTIVAYVHVYQGRDWYGEKPPDADPSWQPVYIVEEPAS